MNRQVNVRMGTTLLQELRAAYAETLASRATGSMTDHYSWNAFLRDALARGIELQLRGGVAAPTTTRVDAAETRNGGASGPPIENDPSALTRRQRRKLEQQRKRDRRDEALQAAAG